jgi:hypothetical protein
MFRYKDDVLSLNNFVDRIYPIEPEIKDTRDTDRSISYLDLHREIDSEGRLGMKLNDKRDDFNIPIVTNVIISREYGKNQKVLPTNGTYRWSL